MAVLIFFCFYCFICLDEQLLCSSLSFNYSLFVIKDSIQEVKRFGGTVDSVFVICRFRFILLIACYLLSWYYCITIDNKKKLKKKNLHRIHLFSLLVCFNAVYLLSFCQNVCKLIFLDTLPCTSIHQRFNSKRVL